MSVYLQEVDYLVSFVCLMQCWQPRVVPKSTNATQILLFLLFLITESQLKRFSIIACSVDGLGEVYLILYCCTGLFCLISGSSELISCLIFWLLLPLAIPHSFVINTPRFCAKVIKKHSKTNPQGTLLRLCVAWAVVISPSAFMPNQFSRWHCMKCLTEIRIIIYQTSVS